MTNEKNPQHIPTERVEDLLLDCGNVTEAEAKEIARRLEEDYDRIFGKDR